MEETKSVTVLIINTGEPPVVKEVPSSLESFQTIVGGYIEAVYLAPELIMYVNEEGMYKQLPHNSHASRIWGQGLSILGNSVIVYHDKLGEPINLTLEILRENGIVIT